MFDRLRELEARGGSIRAAIVGSGFVARGLVHQLGLTPGMTPSLVIARSPEKGMACYVDAGWDARRVVVDDDAPRLRSAIERGDPAVSPTPDVLPELPEIDVVVEATGNVTHGARVAILAMTSSKHVVSLNFEADATVGPLLAEIARRHGVVYTGSDGDQPGVLMRLYEYVRGIGLDVIAAVNCKGFLDIHATPDTIRPWAEKQGTSLPMTTAFTDGTKMNVENACVANATGLTPARRGMIGVETDLAHALEDFRSSLDREGVVDYTLGGDFGGGVFVIGGGADPVMAAPYLEYLKMGQGPWYLFYRPWHLVHFETPLSIAEASQDGRATIAPSGSPIATVVTLAKRNLPVGRNLDGMGGYDCYGKIDLADADGLLPIGLSEFATVTTAVEIDQPIDMTQVEMDEDAPLVRLWRLQSDGFESMVQDDSLLRMVMPS